MHEDNLFEALRARSFVPARATAARLRDPAATSRARCVPLASISFWVADITYVRLAEDFVYLAVVIDAFSRKVVGWALASHLEASLALKALDQALAARDPPPERLIHHSDRGVQYACSDYVERVEDALDRHQHEPARQPLRQRQGGKLHENAQNRGGERQGLPRTSKTPAGQIGEFIETIYNAERLHSALGCKPSVEFEAELPLVTPTRNQEEALSLN